MTACMEGSIQIRLVCLEKWGVTVAGMEFCGVEGQACG
jgi:hypothetical protein